MHAIRIEVDYGKQRTCETFPQPLVRIGRQEGVDCRINLPFVSGLHARLEVRDARLVLRDAGSTIGTFVEGGTLQLAIGSPFDLADVDGEFQIGAVRLRATLVDAPANNETPNPPAPQPQPQPDPQSPPPVDQEPADFSEGEDATRAYEEVDPKSLDGQAARSLLHERLAAYRRARKDTAAAALAAVRSMDPGRAKALLTEVLAEFPELAVRPEVLDEASMHRVEVPWKQGELALRGLREIAGAYVPKAAALDNAAEIARFVWRLDRTLGVAVNAFENLRRAHRRVTGVRVEGPDVGDALLNTTHPPDVPHAVEREVTAMVGMHARLANELHAGVRWLVTQLSPSSVEAACAKGSPLWRGRRFKALWGAYTQAFQRVCSGEGAGPYFRASLAVAQKPA